MRRAAAGLLALVVAGAAAADVPRFGLLWNRAGLPAVFPLQVQSDPGLDWRVTLTEANSAVPALAAAFAGGTFFRVLVPPGSYRLTFEAGPTWTGADFAPPGVTQVRRLEQPLVFAVEGLSRKRGHIVDLRRSSLQAQALKPQTICQHFAPVADLPDLPDPGKPLFDRDPVTGAFPPLPPLRLVEGYC